MFFITIGILLLILVVYLFIKESTSLFATRQKPESATGYKPSVRAVKLQAEDFQIVHRGVSNSTTESSYLNSGIYRLEHQFPVDGKVKVELVSADGSIHKRVVEKSGFGSTTFRVEVAKYFIFHVESEQAATE